METRPKYKTRNSQENAWAKKLLAIFCLGGKCQKCGNLNPIVLEFHHIKDKLFKIGDFWKRRWSVIEPEVRKCVLLCSNCHKIEHTKLGSRNHKVKQRILMLCEKQVCECGIADSRCLEFHHNSNKDFNISDFISRKVKVDINTLIEEISKCEVICSNCHTIKHFTANSALEIAKKKKYKEAYKPLDKNVVLALREEGLSYKQIAKRIGRSKSAVIGIIKRYG